MSYFRLILPALLLLSACSQDNPVANTTDHAHSADEKFEFELTLENTSDKTALATPFAPGLWAVTHDDVKNPLFTKGSTASAGLEALAEDGAPTALNTALDALGEEVVAKATLEEIPPGGKVTFKFEAQLGQKLSFATMLAQTNDVYLSFGDEGIALFDADKEPIKGDLTAQVMVWDAGTEVNQDPGKGADQAPRQAAANTGTAENSSVKLLSEVNDGFNYPEVSQMLKVTLTNNDSHEEHGDEHAGHDE